MGATSNVVFDQAVGLSCGLLLLSGVLIVWRRSVTAAVRLLSVQGAALALLVLAIGTHRRLADVVVVAVVVLVLKSFVLPAVLLKAAGRADRPRIETPLINTTASLILVAVLTALAYLVSQPLQAAGLGPTSAAVPVGMALVLYGFLVLATRMHAIFQLVGFLVIDNGIATVAFLIAGGVPLIVELGASLDLLLVVLVLQVLSGRIHTEFGTADLDDLTELRD